MTEPKEPAPELRTLDDDDLERLHQIWLERVAMIENEAARRKALEVAA